jgi:hypothetical protein
VLILEEFVRLETGHHLQPLQSLIFKSPQSPVPRSPPDVGASDGWTRVAWKAREVMHRASLCPSSAYV